MKRVMVFSLVGLLVLALVGLVMAESWDLRCLPGEVEEEDVSGIVAGQPTYNGLKHKIECHVDNGIWDTAHAGWVHDGATQLFRREVSLLDNTTDLVYDRITLGDATWYVHVNDNGTGYSDFNFVFPYSY